MLMMTMMKICCNKLLNELHIAGLVDSAGITASVSQGESELASGAGSTYSRAELTQLASCTAHV